jgi:predicted regulator of Ras-like GTPase activity (Roadblock/LC7/MglB family)
MKSETLNAALGDGYVATCEEALQKLLRDLLSVTAAVVATGDGFEVASVQADGQMSATRLSALASSLLALGQAALRELSMTGSGSVLIEKPMGKILLVDVRRERLPVVLCVVADAGAMTGKLLWAARQCADALKASAS